MSSPELDRAVDHCPLFQGLDEEERRDVTALLEMQAFRSGQEILVEGTSQAALWIVVEGKCEVVKCQEKQRVLAVIEPPGIFGEMSFFHPATSSATVRGVGPVSVARLSGEKFDSLQRLRPRIGYTLAINTIGVLAERLRHMDEWACQFLESASRSEHSEEWSEFQSKLYSGWKF